MNASLFVDGWCLACGENGLSDVGRDADLVDHDGVSSLEGVDHLGGPDVLERDQQR